MAAKATTTTPRTRRTKAEVQREFDQISDDIEKSQESESPKAEESARLRDQEVRKSVEGLSADGVVQDMARLRLDVTRALGELSEKLAQEVMRLESVRGAVALETQEIGRLHKIDVAATALDQMVRDYKEQQGSLEEEIEGTRAKWAAESEQRERERKEQEQLLGKQRQREAEEYEYKKVLERKKDKDRYEEECRVRDTQHREKQEAQERSWQQREAALKEREEELSRIKKESEEFPGRLEREVKKAAAESRAAVQKEFEQQLVLLKKDGEVEKRMAELQIQTLKETASKQLALIESLQRQLDEAKKQVQDIAVKAIEGASGSRALSHVNQIAMEQAKHRPPA